MNVPKLRFKEFKDEWKEKKLGDITNFSKGKLISKDDISESGNECIRYGEIYTHYNEVIYEIKSKTQLDKKDLVLSEKNDVIIPSSGETALDIAKACCVMKSGVALGGDINILKLNENGIFISYYLNNKKKKDIAALAQGASVIHLYENHLKLLNLNFPSLQEQEKIANFLSSVDKKIELTEDKLEAFKEYKKGVMQKIFSQEIRFKDENGNDYPEWEEKKYNTVFSVSQGLQISISERFTKKEEGLYFYITNEFLKKNSQIKYYVKNPSKNVICNITDILMTRTGNTGIVVTGVSGVFHNNFFKIKYDQKKYNKLFICYLLKSNKVQNMIIKYAGASTIPDLNHSDFYRIKSFFPSLPEQEKIANFLSAIDEKIEKIENSLNELKEFKKGLLQQMFV